MALYAREHLIKKLSLAFNLIRAQAETFNVINLNDISVVSEDVFASVLNHIGDLSLRKLGRSNHPGIDLGDKQNGICYQVTTLNTPQKLRHTIQQYLNAGYHTDYPQLRVLIVGVKSRKGYSKLSVPSGVRFVPDEDVIDIPDLTRQIGGLADNRLQSLSDLMDNEVPVLRAPHLQPVLTDVQALKVMRGLFNRPAFQDDWRGERNVKDFADRLTDLIGLLGSGHWQNVQRTKGREDFDDDEWRDDLENVYRAVRDLLSLYTKHVRSGEIDPVKNEVKLRDETTYDLFNNGKDAVIGHMNKLLRRANLPTIDGVQRWQPRKGNGFN